ncbi:MAG: zinc-ribbon domain-containing protein [Candidatus Eremiobacteraeota bacterium]|nr:zinc-ribbon domain-containing protein [Candidatus Eremiobacteraeota bacterium]
MFIFDAGQTRKKVHGIRIERCEACKRQRPHRLTEVGTFVSVLDAPVVPYKKRFILICQKCGGGKELTKIEFDRLKRYREGQETESYNLPVEEDKSIFEYEKTRHSGKKYCIHCGSKLRKGAVFCNECGQKVKKV